MDVFSGKKQRPYELARRLEQQRAEAARLAAQDRQKSSPVFLSTLSSVIPETIVTLALLVMIFYFIMGYLQPPDAPTVDTGDQEEEEKKKKKKKGGCVKNVALVGMSFTAFCFGLAKVGLGWKETIGALVTFATLSSAFLYQSQCAPTLGRCTVLWMISMAQGALFVLNAKTGVLSLQSIGAMTFTTGAAMAYYMVECSSGPDNPNPEPGEPTSDGVPEDVPLTNDAGSMDPLFTGLVSVGAGLVIATALNVLRNLFMPPTVTPQEPDLNRDQDAGQEQAEAGPGDEEELLAEHGNDMSTFEIDAETAMKLARRLKEISEALKSGEVTMDGKQLQEQLEDMLPQGTENVVTQVYNKLGEGEYSEILAREAREALEVERKYNAAIEKVNEALEELKETQKKAKENTKKSLSLWQRLKGKFTGKTSQQTSFETAVDDSYEVQRSYVKYYYAVTAAFTAFLVYHGINKEVAKDLTESFEKSQMGWLEELEQNTKTKEKWKEFLMKKGYYPISFSEKYEEMVKEIEDTIDRERQKMEEIGLNDDVIDEILHKREEWLELIQERRELLAIGLKKRTKKQRRRIKEIGEKLEKEEQERQFNFLSLLMQGEFRFARAALGNLQTHYTFDQLTPDLLLLKLEPLDEIERGAIVRRINLGTEPLEDIWREIQRVELGKQPGWLSTISDALDHPVGHALLAIGSQIAMYMWVRAHGAPSNLASVEEHAERLASQFGEQVEQIAFMGEGRRVGHIPSLLPQHGRQNPDGLPFYWGADANGIVRPNPERWRGGG